MKIDRATNERPFSPDWIVSRIVDHGPAVYYRFTVTGINLNHPEGHPDRTFSWSVPDDPRSYWRYDTSNAEVWV